VAHADVHDDEIGRSLAGEPDAFVAGFGAENFQRLLFEQAAEGVVDVLLVVDNEDGLESVGGGRRECAVMFFVGDAPPR
jgi:hypothetical protein